MDSIATEEPKLKWRAPTIVAAIAILAVLALLIGSTDIGVIVSLFLVVPAIAIVLIVFMFVFHGKTRTFCVALICVFGLLSWQMLKRSEQIRSEARWLVSSNYWKARVLQQPPRTTSGMKCGIWDGWGFAGSDTNVYLIFSPKDELRNYSPTNLNGLPIPVSSVQRMEKYWYSVTFYTDDGWEGCAYFQ